MKTSIWLNTYSGTVDLFEDLPLPLTYSIADVREPESRNHSYSKTITLPGTDKNNKIFNHLFNVGAFIQTSGSVNFQPDFNPNLKEEVRVYVGSAMVMKGILKLDNVYITDKHEVRYECTIFGKTANIFANLGNVNIQDLNWSNYNHAYSKTVQKASWSATVGGGYVYPMIDYGRTNATLFNVTDFFPAVYLREYIQKIFEYAGFQFSSAFFDSSYFKHLIIPFSGDKLSLSASQIANRKFRASRDTSVQTISGTQSGANGTILFNNDSTTPNNDAGGCYNTGTGIFTAPANGIWDFSAVVPYQLTYNPTGTASMSVFTAVQIRKIDNSNFDNLVAGSGLQTNSVTNISSAFTTGTFTQYITAPSVALQQGERVYIKIVTTASSSAGVITVDDKIQTGAYFVNTLSNTAIQEGDTVTLANAIAPNVRASDLLKWIIKTWNLYVDVDQDVENKLIIEPYNDFYNSTVEDWTQYLDISSEIKIQPMGALESRRYVWKSKDDTDYFNDKYYKNWGETYGRKQIDVNNDFLVNEKVIEVGWSPTPLVDVPGTDRIISRIYAVDQSGNVSQKATNIRILYYGGVKNTLQGWAYNSTQSGNSTENTYPYAGHLDDVYNPSYDINFGVPREVYYNITSGATYTDANIYNEYWRQHVEEITDRNSKIVTGMFKLPPSKIALLSFRKKYYIDQYYYRLNKIIDYNPVEDGLTRVELLKIKNGTPWSRVRVVMNGLYTTMGNDLTPSIGSPNLPLGDVGGGGSSPTRTGSGLSSRGGNNRLGINTSGCTIDSSMLCVIGDECARVGIMNSSGCTVESGLTDVFIMNSSGVTVSTSSTTVINNNVYFKGVGSTRPVKGVLGVAAIGRSSDTLVEFDASDNASTYNLPIASSTAGKIIYVTKIDATANVMTVGVTGGGTINGSTTASTSVQFYTFGFYSNGSQYRIV